MPKYNGLKRFLSQFANNVGVIYTVGQHKPNKIVRVDLKGFYVETEKSRKEHEEGEPTPYRLVQREWIEDTFDTLVNKGVCTPDDIEEFGRRHSFLIAFLAALPFTEVEYTAQEPVVRLKRFTTADLPGDFNDSMHFIKDELESQQQKLLKSPFFKLIYDMLGFMGESLPVKEKKEILIKAMFLTVVSSTSSTQITESVATRRLSNTLKWLEQMGLIDQSLNPIHNKELNDQMVLDYQRFLNDPLHKFYVKLRCYQAGVIRDLLSDPESITLKKFNEEVWRIGHVLTDNGPFDVFKLMQTKDNNRLRQLREALQNGQLCYVGNACWGSGSKVFGAQLKYSDDEKLNLVKRALNILNQEELSPFEKAKQIMNIPGFGNNISSGMVMLYHPNQFSIYNKQSIEALNKLGYETNSVELFQQSIQDLRQHVGATDFIELDWFLYCYNQNEIEMKGTAIQSKQFWWVNQGQSHKSEKEGGYLWAPQQVKGGTSFSHHTDLLKAQPNDVVFAYANGQIRSVCLVKQHAQEHKKPTELSSDSWQVDGYLLSVNYFEFQPIRKDDIPLEWRMDEPGPFDRNGNVKQGYFFSVSEEFVSKLYQKFATAFPQQVKQHLPLISNEKIQNTVLFPSDVEAVDHIHAYISNKGFYYEKDDVKNLYLSLKTKPFVILSGISGTGKTKIVQWFAKSLGATEDNGRFTLIPVRPDWSDGSDLLGYVDIKGEFQEKPLTKVLKAARENQDKPYFVLLDEMNLARVEYYFSDLLSVMESRKRVGDRTITAPVLPKEDIGETLRIPPNVYFIGTVNMDETTHPFSKKVLDRANTIEFNHVQLDNFAFLDNVNEEEMPVEVANGQLCGKFLHLKDAYEDNKDLIHRVTGELIKVNDILQKTGAHVGYRVRDEICFYMIYTEKGNLMMFDQALDYQLLQKVLPRLSGSDERVQSVLEDLYQYCTGFVIDGELPTLAADENVARFPKSAQKIDQMLRRLSADGFTSFWL